MNPARESTAKYIQYISGRRPIENEHIGEIPESSKQITAASKTMDMSGLSVEFHEFFKRLLFRN
jgi:hypothetical protein